MPTIDLDRLLSRDIQRPARYLGNEIGSAHRSWDSAQVRWVLSFPELYEVGSSNSGHIILYNILNTRPDQLCDRVYLPGSDFAQRLQAQQVPLFALESRRPLREFDLLGFSLSYELGGTNVLEMLHLAGIPLTWQERQPLTLAECPLVFAGGPTATSNPEPFADYFDFFVLGDGEEVLVEIGEVVKAGLAEQLPRVEMLRALAQQVAGVYVPQFYGGMPLRPLLAGIPARVVRRVAPPMPEFAVGPIAYLETVHDRLVMEVRRGCTRGCRFCQPGMLTRPARDVDPDRMVNAVLQGLQKTGYDEFSLSSLSCSDYLSLPAVGAELQNRLGQSHTTLSLPSQRVDRFDEQIASIMGGSRRVGLTFAPEAGTQRLRDIINKGLTDADLVRGIQTAVEQGWKKIKLYFMIGLPGERDEDVIGIAETLAMVQRTCGIPKPHSVEFTLTISNFTPKPHTPFQWHRVDYDEIRRKQKLLKEHLRRLRGVKAHYTDVRFSILEDLIGKGDRRLAPMMAHAWKSGAGMDAWWENIDEAYDAWVQAYREGVPLEEVPSEAHASTGLTIREYDLEDPLPWDHIDTGVDKRWLQADYQRALAAVTVPDCSFASCSQCGVCGPDLGHNIVLPAPPVPTLTTVKPEHPSQVASVPPHQRFRLRFIKQGDLRWVGHLDLMRVWERACRRAGLPLAYTYGFRPTPRLALCSALPLGYTSQGELLDLELDWGSLSPTAVQQALSLHLPPELAILAIEAIPQFAPSAAQQLLEAEYRLTVQALIPHPNWLGWVDQLLAADVIEVQKTSKSNRIQTWNGRALLQELVCEAVLFDPDTSNSDSNNSEALLRYRGSARSEAFLSPEQVIKMLESSSGPGTLKIRTVERIRLVLQSPPTREPDPCPPSPVGAET